MHDWALGKFSNLGSQDAWKMLLLGSYIPSYIAKINTSKKKNTTEQFEIPKIFPKVFFKKINPKKNPITFKNSQDLDLNPKSGNCDL